MDSTNVQALLGLENAPIAVGYLDEIPANLPAWDGGAVPAGCTFWRHAQEGRAFYTVASDHYNCAVGAYTHNLELPAERSGELSQTLQFMDVNNYVMMEEVPGIPMLQTAPRYIAFGPVDKVTFEPDVVIVSAKPAQAMLLYEAALKGGASGALMNTLGRPACAILPLALSSGSAALSLGCKGNRTYTGLPDGEMYVSIPGGKWKNVVDQLGVTLAANAAIAAYHSIRKVQFQAV